jgi:hypothetical protein
VSLVSAPYGALFTHSWRPRVAAHRTFGAEAAWDLAPAASCLLGHHARAASSPDPRRSRRAALLAPLKPSAPKHDCPRLRHRWSALLRWAAPARQNSHDSKSIGVSVKPAFRRLLGVTVAAREPKPSAWPGVDKASEGHFPNSSPSSVRAVLSSRWAELTTNSSQVEEWASELPRTAHADADPSKRRAPPFENFTVVRSCRRGKTVNLLVTGAIIGADLL